MGKKILALNIGASSVTLAEYERSGGGLTLCKYGKASLAAPIDSGNAATILAPAMLEIVREKGIKPGRVAVSVPGQMVFPRFAAITPAGGDDKFAQLVRYEIEQNVPFPIDEMVCDHAVLGDTASGDTAVMIVAAKTEQMESVAAAVQAAGFEPELVDVTPIALANLLKANQAASGSDGECAVILDIGAKTTTLAIVEGEKMYNRSIPVGGNTLTRDIAQLLGCTQDEAEKIKLESAYVSLGGTTEDSDETLDAIAKTCRATMTRLHAEVSRSINFYRSQQGGGAPTKLYLSGGSSLLPGVDGFFQESLQIEVGWLNPFETVAVAPGAGQTEDAIVADAAFFAATAGVALHAAGLAAIPINLMPPSLLDARAESARVPFVAIGSAAMAAAAFCWLFASMGETQRLEERTAEVRAEADRLESVKKAGDAAAEKAAAAYAAATNLAARLSRKGAAAARIRTVKAAIEPDFWIARWDEKIERVSNPAAKAKGGAETPATVEARVVRVTVRGWKNRMKALVEREVTLRAPAAMANTEAAKADQAAIVAAAQNAPKGVSSAKTEVSFKEKKHEATVTPGMIVVSRLVASGAFKPGTVKIIAGLPLGPEGCLEEFTVAMQFKENQDK